jgi:hypothetical protein
MRIYVTGLRKIFISHELISLMLFPHHLILSFTLFSLDVSKWNVNNDISILDLSKWLLHFTQSQKTQNLHQLSGSIFNFPYNLTLFLSSTHNISFFSKKNKTFLILILFLYRFSILHRLFPSNLPLFPLFEC